MQPHVARKAHIDDLHREIDLLDRKVAHYQDVEQFDSESERSRAVQKLMKMREGLVEIAVQRVASGVSYNAKYLPRSFRP